MANAETVIQTAEFNDSVCTYWLLSGALTLTATIVGIPLLVLWFPLGMVFTRRYLEKMECQLTEKALKVKKGILVRTEKTIPLDKITDMGMVQGPIMRHFGLHTLTIETAGQSGTGALVSLTGIRGAQMFRERVLGQRDVIATKTPGTPEASDGAESSNISVAILREIRDSLLRIETKINESAK